MSERDAGKGLPSDAGADPEALDAAPPRDPADLEWPDASQSRLLDAQVQVPDASAPRQRSLSDYLREEDPFELPGIADNASDIAWRADTGTFFVVENTAARLSEYGPSFGVRIRTVDLLGAGGDMEGLAYLGQGRFAVVNEDNELFVLTLPDDATSVDLSAAPNQRYVVAPPPATDNRGFEGVAFVPGGETDTLLVCQEGGDPLVPRRVLQFQRRSDGLSFDFADDLVVLEPWDAQSGFAGIASDLSGLHYDVTEGSLLLLSHESSVLLRVELTSGIVLDTLLLDAAPQYEGVTLADDRLVLVSEPNLVEIRTAP